MFLMCISFFSSFQVIVLWYSLYYCIGEFNQLAASNFLKYLK